MSDTAILEVESGNGTKRYKLGGKPITVGRGSGNVLALDDDQASRQHAVIEHKEGQFHVRDLGSRNGTTVNGDRTRGKKLAHKDVIVIGNTSMRILLPEGVTDDNKEGLDLENENVEGRETRKAPKLKQGKIEVGDDLASQAQASRAVLAHALNNVPGESPDAAAIHLINARGSAASTDEIAEETSIVSVLRDLLKACIHLRATDLHLEPKREEFQARVRIDGMMVELGRLPKDVGSRLVSIVKVLADIDITQRNIVQEGTFTSKIPDRHIDYRVSFTPTTFGQKLVLRVLDLANAPQFLSEMQVPPWTHKALKEVMQQDAGMVLVAGPTGSGKTTSLYALIREINVEQRNVVTIEDPVEYHIEGVTQIPINEMQGNSFSNVLRSVLRQDPDVILVGEVRDAETARIAMQAAITGHLVLSTVHARDTIGAIFRLLDLGVEPYVVGSGLNLVLAQRLIRTLCPHCKVDRTPTPEETRKMNLRHEGLKAVYKAGGCDRCLDTGYHGRRAVFELLAANQQLRDVILNNPTITDIKDALGRTMFTTLGDNGYAMVAEGVTSVGEIERVTGGEG